MTKQQFWTLFGFLVVLGIVAFLVEEPHHYQPPSAFTAEERTQMKRNNGLTDKQSAEVMLYCHENPNSLWCK